MDTAPPASSPAPPSPGGSADAPPGAARSLTRNTLLLSAGTLVSRVLGMARETMVAAMFDVGTTDAFFQAWRVPNAFRAMLAEGAARYAFNPVFGKALHDGHDGGDGENRERLRVVLARVKGAMLLVLGVVTVLGMVFARPLFRVMTAGMHGDAYRFELGVTLLRLLFPYLFLMGWFAIGNSVLQLLNVFRPGAFAPVMLNVAFLTVPFALVPLLRPLGVPPIYSMAIAALVGGVLQVLWLRPALRRENLLPSPRLEFDDSVKQLGRLFVPQLYGQAVYQLNVLLAGRFLGSLPEGSPTFFSYAQRLADIPQGVFAIALSGAAAAALQKDATRKDFVALARTYESAIRMAAFVAVPLCVILSVYGEAIVPVIFAYGRFRARGPGAWHEVAASLRWQALGIGALAFVHQTTAVFGALEKRRVVVEAATVSLTVYGLVGYVGSRTLGHAGVALAMAASTAAQLAYLLWAVNREIRPAWSQVAPSLAKVLGATGLTALAARAAVVHLPVTTGTWSSKLLAVGCGVALVGVYLLAAWVLRCDEMIALQRRLRSRLRSH
ncbi:MAG: murein biosynthesis integral membrane protein MurJ [Deltaproteobacteria bacterium]